MQLKKKYKALNWLKSDSGFGWDDALKLSTVPDSVCDELLQVRLCMYSLLVFHIGHL